MAKFPEITKIVKVLQITPKLVIIAFLVVVVVVIIGYDFDVLHILMKIQGLYLVPELRYPHYHCCCCSSSHHYPN